MRVELSLLHPVTLSLFHPFAWAKPQDAEDAIFWSNAWPYSEESWAGIPSLFLFKRVI